MLNKSISVQRTNASTIRPITFNLALDCELIQTMRNEPHFSSLSRSLPISSVELIRYLVTIALTIPSPWSLIHLGYVNLSLIHSYDSFIRASFDSYD